MRSHCANTPIIQHPFTDRLLLLSRWLTIEFIIFFLFRAPTQTALLPHHSPTSWKFNIHDILCNVLRLFQAERKMSWEENRFASTAVLSLFSSSSSPFLIIFESIQWFSSHFEIIAITYRVVLHNLLFLFSALCDWRSDWQHNIIDFRLMCRT